jgi:hypothetical protein
MAKVTGPLFSLRARASIGKTLTYSSWRGIQYVRTDVIPANPNTSDQRDRRAVFSYLNGVWLRSGTNLRQPWTLQASGQPYTDRNHFVGVNAKEEFNQGNLDGFIFSPGNGAPPPVSCAAVDGGANVNFTVVPGDPPLGWSLINVWAAILLDADPTADPATPIVANSDASDPYTPSIPAANGTYHFAAWNQMTDPAGVTRYSISTPPGTVVMA